MTQASHLWKIGHEAYHLEQPKGILPTTGKRVHHRPPETTSTKLASARPERMTMVTWMAWPQKDDHEIGQHQQVANSNRWPTPLPWCFRGHASQFHEFSSSFGSARRPSAKPSRRPRAFPLDPGRRSTASWTSVVQGGSSSRSPVGAKRVLHQAGRPPTHTLRPCGSPSM